MIVLHFHALPQGSLHYFSLPFFDDLVSILRAQERQNNGFSVALRHFGRKVTNKTSISKHIVLNLMFFL